MLMVFPEPTGNVIAFVESEVPPNVGALAQYSSKTIRLLCGGNSVITLLHCRGAASDANNHGGPGQPQSKSSFAARARGEAQLHEIVSKLLHCLVIVFA